MDYANNTIWQIGATLIALEIWE